MLTVVTEQHGGVILLLQLSQTLKVGKKIVGPLVDGAAGRRGRFPAFLCVNSITCGDDVSQTAGFDDKSGNSGSVRILNEECQIRGKRGRFPYGLVRYAFHVKQALDVCAVSFAREHAEAGVLQFAFGNDDVFDGFCALEVAKTSHVVEVQMGEDNHVDVGTAQPMQPQRFFNGNEAAHGINAVDVFAVFPSTVRAVAGVVENVSELRVSYQQGADRGAVHSALVASCYNTEILAVEMPEREHVHGWLVHTGLLVCMAGLAW